MKKLFALLLAVVMVIGMAACAPADDVKDTTAAKSTTAAKETTTAAATTTAPAEDWSSFDLTGIVADNKINVGIMTNATVLNYNENDLTKYMEELTGLDIEFTFFSSDSTEAKQQLNLMIANKEKLPDVLFGMVDQIMASEYGQQGLLCDLTEMIDKAYYLGAVIDTMNDYEKNYFWNRLYDGATGEIYHFPTPYINDGVDSNEWIGALSTTMAANVGMDAAEIDTIDEVYQYLSKTVHEDGNGNGVKDEVGLVYRQAGYRSNIEMWIINAYVYCSDQYIFNVNDGEVWLPFGTDEYRQAMVTMHKWYAEGLISPLSYSIKDNAEHKALVDMGQGNYTCVAWGGHPTLITAADSLIALDYTHMNTLADETGKGGYANIRDTYALLKNAVIPMNEAEPERMELAFRFCDIQCNDEVHMHWRYGVKGENWDWRDGEAEGVKDRRGNWAGLVIINDTWSTETNDTWHIDPIYAHSTGSYEAGLSAGSTELVDQTGKRGAISYGCLWEKWEHEQPEEIIFDLVYNTEETEVYNEYAKLYMDYVKQARAQMITGVIDPNDDAQWAKYLSELKANGEEELIEAAQSAYDRMNG